MNRFRQESDWSPTVLDLLLQPLSQSGEIAARSRNPQRDSIARDLEALLNTRREEELVPPEYEEAAKSLLNFGFPEVTSYGNLSSPIEQTKLCKAMEEAIRLFEPRLKKVSVRVAMNEKRSELLGIRIEGTIDSLGEREVFNLGFQRDSGRMSIEAGGTA
jgi:type VI secretion system protein ImpF